ncbi:MAG TPA: DUF6306 domain-containing protein [Alphaproteobacteria bacterium]
MNDEKRDSETSGYSSPACLLHEMDGPYAGYLGSAELIELLNTLLDAELTVGEVARAGAPESPAPEVLHVIEVAERDATRFAAMLKSCIGSLGGEPGECAKAYQGDATASQGFAERLTLLNEGQDGIVRKLSEALPRVRDDRLHAVLKEMLDAHQANLTLGTAIIQAHRGR